MARAHGHKNGHLFARDVLFKFYFFSARLRRLRSVQRPRKSKGNAEEKKQTVSLHSRSSFSRPLFRFICDRWCMPFVQPRTTFIYSARARTECIINFNLFRIRPKQQNNEREQIVFFLFGKFA